MGRPDVYQVRGERSTDVSRWVCTLWLILALVMAVRTLASPIKHTVFPIFAASSINWWTDKPLYNFDPSLDLFRYSPTFAVCVSPFAALGLSLGGILWIWLSLAVYAVGLWRFAKDVLPEEWSKARLVGFHALALFVALPGIWNSQSNTLVVGLILLASSNLIRERWWFAAVLLAVAVWTKLTPLAPALLLCALRPSKLTPRFVATLAMGALIPFLTRPPTIVVGHYAEWWTSLSGSGGNRWPGFRDGWTLWLALSEFCQRQNRPYWLIMPIDSIWYRALQAISALGVLAWCLWNRKSASPRWLLSTTLGLGMAWMMLFGPAVEHTTFVFLAPSLAWAMLQRETELRWLWLPLTAFALIAILGWDPLTGSLLKRLPLMAISLPLGAVLFMIWQIRYAFHCRLHLARSQPVVPSFIEHKDRMHVGGMRAYRPRPVLS
jgi:hypothetical protein